MSSFSLYRVSSRQRLVSWDAFDASTKSVNDDDHYHDTNESISSTTTRTHPTMTTMDMKVVEVVESSLLLLLPNHPPQCMITRDDNECGDNMMMMNTNTTTGSQDDDVTNMIEHDESIVSSSWNNHRKRRMMDVIDMTTSATSNVATTTSSTSNSSLVSLMPTSHIGLCTEANDDDIHMISSSSSSSSSMFHDCCDTTAVTTTTTTTTAVPNLLLDIPFELQIYIFQFLNVSDICCLTHVCHTLRSSLLSFQNHHNDNNTYHDKDDTEAMMTSIWNPFCERYWPYLQQQDDESEIQHWYTTNSSSSSTSMYRSYHHGDHHQHSSTSVNYPMVLSMAKMIQPTHIDTSKFPCHYRWNRSTTSNRTAISGSRMSSSSSMRSSTSLRQINALLSDVQYVTMMKCHHTNHDTSNHHTTTSTSSNTTMENTINNDNVVSSSSSTPVVVVVPAIQFIGMVGFGDQCIRANQPLPRPSRMTTTHSSRFGTTTTNHNHHLMHLFRNHQPNNTTRSSSSSSNTTKKSITLPGPIQMIFCPLQRRRSLRLLLQQQQQQNDEGNDNSTGSSNSSSHDSYPSNYSTMSFWNPYSNNNKNNHNKFMKYRPFCVPFACRQEYHNENPSIHNDSMATISLRNVFWNMSLRYISYYEVTILPLSCISLQNQNDTNMIMNHNSTIRPNINIPINNVPHVIHGSAPDCVAIGLATNAFPLQNRMPGWDDHSYGYHGDDGGLFHGAGSMMKDYGHRFGMNDTVGCGIDYIHQAIFYTLNGIFLGYAFDLSTKKNCHHLDCDLYPVIGMDTNYPIICNFGTNLQQPFQFDLCTMMKHHEPIIQQQWH